MKIEKTADDPGAMFVKDSVSYKKGRHGYTYRWNGEEWVRSSSVLEKIFGGGYVLRVPRPVPKVVSEFAMPLPQVTNR